MKVSKTTVVVVRDESFVSGVSTLVAPGVTLASPCKVTCALLSSAYPDSRVVSLERGKGAPKVSATIVCESSDTACNVLMSAIGHARLGPVTVYTTPGGPSVRAITAAARMAMLPASHAQGEGSTLVRVDSGHGVTVKKGG